MLARCLAALLVLALAPAAVAQVASPLLVIDRMVVETTPVSPGNSTAVTAVFSRVCPNAAAVLDPQTLDTAVVALDRNWTVAGPMQGLFAQQVCATQGRQSIELTYTMSLAPGSALPEPHVDPFVLKARAAQASPTTPAIAEQTAPFTLATAASPPAPLESPSREQPGLGTLGAFLALGLVAVALARRR